MTKYIRLIPEYGSFFVMTKALSFLVRGRVQGVGFRYWTRHRASLLGLKGWVRNRPDGAVEGVMKGRDEQLNAMLEQLHCGPSGARVDDVEVSGSCGEVPDDFLIRP